MGNICSTSDHSGSTSVLRSTCDHSSCTSDLHSPCDHSSCTSVLRSTCDYSSCTSVLCCPSVLCSPTPSVICSSSVICCPSIWRIRNSVIWSSSVSIWCTWLQLWRHPNCCGKHRWCNRGWCGPQLGRHPRCLGGTSSLSESPAFVFSLL